MAVHDSGFENAAFFDKGRQFLDIFTGRGLVGSHVGLGQFLLGGVFIVVGAIWLAIRRTSYAARALIFTGAVQWVTIEAAWQIKEVFGRMRPFQLIEKNDWSHIWFMGSNSFPSGHNAFFWGLFVPLMYPFPRWRIAAADRAGVHRAGPHRRELSFPLRRARLDCAGVPGYADRRGALRTLDRRRKTVAQKLTLRVGRIRALMVPTRTDRRVRILGEGLKCRSRGICSAPSLRP